MRSQSNLLEKSRRKLVMDLYEVDKSLIRAICPTDESMRRFRSSLITFDSGFFGSLSFYFIIYFYKCFIEMDNTLHSYP